MSIILFFKTTDKYGFFSNWANSPFTAYNIKFKNSEQFMMWKKAKIMEDEESADLISKTTSPYKVKQLGRKVRNFDQKLWDRKKIEVMVEALTFKFNNSARIDLLLSTGDAIIAEASPYDKIWGIGLDASDPNSKDQEKWKGQNLLGKCLMTVRENLREQINENK